MVKNKILFLAVGPTDTRRIALDREAHAIHVELKRSGYRDRFEFVPRWISEPIDLLRDLRELRPTVVHFCGSGDDATLLLGAKSIEPAALAQTFSAAGSSVALVVFSGCSSAPHIEALLAHVDHVVGIGGTVHEDAARIFAIGFYGGLGECDSIASAYRQGEAAIELHGLPDGARPQLHVRGGVDSTRFVLAETTDSDTGQAPPCPYPGMRPYSAETARYFYGRTKEINEILTRLRAGERELYMIGPSGSGKSSLIAAGLLPRLVRGATGLGPFVVRTMRPGERPLAQLRAALGATIDELLAHRSQGARLLLVVDQFEELFAIVGPEDRAAFLHALRELRADARCVTVLVLRADFYGALMDSTLWAELDGRLRRLDIAPLHGAALREAIAQPAIDVGVTIEPALVERLASDAGGEPGILPLLQETLNQLWDQQQQGRLDLAQYEALGANGFGVAIAARCDAVIGRLSPEGRLIAQRVLLRLISFGEGRSDTRRSQQIATLKSDEEREVVHHLINERLLTSDEERLDLAHEVMITAWPTLASWIHTRRTDEQQRRRLEAAAAQWIALGAARGGLFDDVVLTEIEAWQQTESARELGWSSEAAALLESSRAAVQQRATDEGLQRKQLQRLRAQPHREAGRQHLIDGDSQRAMAYLSAARNAGHEDEALRMLIAAATRGLPVVPILYHRDRVTSAEFSPDGTRVVTASNDHTARVWNVATGSPLSPPLSHDGPVNVAVFSSDGTRVATASKDKTARIWETATGQLIATIEHRGPVHRAVFSADGSRVLTASSDTTARISDARSGRPLSPLLEHQGAVVRAAFSPDGSRVVTASSDKTARIWDAVTGQLTTPPLAHPSPVMNAAFNPAGTQVVTTSSDATARVWIADTGEPVGAILRHTRAVIAAAYSRDGSRIVTSSDDGSARVWKASNGTPLSFVLKHKGPVTGAQFSLDGTRIVTSSVDGVVQIWDATSGNAVGNVLFHPGEVSSASFSPDGNLVATATSQSSAWIWRAADNDSRCVTLAQDAPVHCAAFSTRGDLAVVVDHRVRLWDVGTAMPTTTSLTHRDVAVTARFDPSSKRIATTSDSKTVKIWDAASGRLIVSCPHNVPVIDVCFSADGSRIVSWSIDGIAQIWDVSTGMSVAAPFVHNTPVTRAAITTDGRGVMTTDDRKVQLWNVTTSVPIRIPIKLRNDEAVWAISRDTSLILCIRGNVARLWSAKPEWAPAKLHHEASIVGAEFSADGSRIVTVCSDNTVCVWDCGTIERLVSFKHPSVRSASFSDDTRFVATAGGDGTVMVWNPQTGEQLAEFGHPAPVSLAALSSDGERLVTASLEKVRVWDIRSRSVLATVRHLGFATGASFSCDGTRIATAGSDGIARIWDAATGDAVSTQLEHRRRNSVARTRLSEARATRRRYTRERSAALSPDGTCVVTTEEDGTARVRDVATGTLIAVFLYHSSAIRSVTFSADGSRIVTASQDGTARLWCARTGEPVAVAFEHESPVCNAVFRPDGGTVLTLCGDHSARVWRENSEKPVALLTHRGTVNSAAFSHDGTRIVTAGADHRARLWDATTCAPLGLPLSHAGSVDAASFNLDGAQVVTASADNSARIWDSHTGTPITLPFEHAGPVSSAVFSPDGTRVVTTSAKSIVSVWDIMGRPLTKPIQHSRRVSTAVFSPDGRHLLVYGDDARIWDVPLDETPPSAWAEQAARSPFVLNGNVHVLRTDLELRHR